MKLTYRERLLLITAAVAIVLGSGYAALVKPALHRLHTLERVMPEKLADLEELRLKCCEYRTLKNKLDDMHVRLAAQKDQPETLPFLEALAEQCRLSPNITSMNQQVRPLNEAYEQTVVTIELKGLTDKQLINFLSQVTSNPQALSIMRLDITKDHLTADLINATVHIAGIRARLDS